MNNIKSIESLTDYITKLNELLEYPDEFIIEHKKADENDKEGKVYDIISFNDTIEKYGESSGPLFRAAYLAYYNSNNHPADISIDMSDDETEEALKHGIIAENIEKESELSREKQLNDAAAKFAVELCKALKDNKFMNNIASITQSYINSLEISINLNRLKNYLTYDVLNYPNLTFKTADPDNSISVNLPD